MANGSQQKNNIGCGGAILLAIIILWAIGAATGSDSSSSSDSGAKEDSAKEVCHKAVRAQLKSPATADFHDEATDTVGNKITVTGSVDSENGFGALLTSTFDCGTKVDGDYVRLDGYPLVLEGG